MPGTSAKIAAEAPSPPTVLAAEPTARLSDAGRRFGDLVALEDVTIDVVPGSLLGVIGPSGAGKTTAIRLLTGGLRPTAGSVRVFGEDPTRLRSSTRERIGFMPQQVSLYDDLTVRENLDFVASLFGLLLVRRRRRIRAILEWLDLADAAGRRAASLSGGMQRRLQLACAVVHDPDLVILDEPTAAVDPILRRRIWDELRRLREAGRTLIVTTQYVPEAEECDIVALIGAGRLIALGPPEALRRAAYGGDLLEVETTAMIDADRLRGTPIGRVRQLGPRTLLVTTDDAATATPPVIEAIEATGGAVASIREHRPSFDDVFTRLVEGHLRAAAPPAAAPAPGAAAVEHAPTATAARAVGTDGATASRAAR